MKIKVSDCLEVRNAEGDVHFDSVSIMSIDGDVIQTTFGRFRITGGKNSAGIETYEHVANEGDYSALHAILKTR